MAEYKTYYGKNLNEALMFMKMDLGVDAKIIKQETVRKGGFLIFGGKPMVKLVASKPDNNHFMFMKHRERIDKPINEKEVKLEKELKEIKETLSKLMENRDVLQNNNVQSNIIENIEENRIIAKYRRLLRENDFGDDIIENIMKEIKENNIEDENEIRIKIKEYLKSLIRVTKNLRLDSNSPTIMFFVGPTGVGKTTTLVKLAANYTIKEKKKVEIFTIDNYRVGAVEQLKLYASIMQTPFRKVDNKVELKDLIKESDADIILIDTAGRSPKDEISISKLRDFVKSLDIFKVKVFLVISADKKKSDILRTADKYSITDFDYLLYTKLDETDSTGAIIDASYRIKKPISFVTYGQDVPKHIGVVDPELLVEFAVKE